MAVDVMAEDQTSVLPSPRPAAMAIATRLSPASDADRVDPESPEPMETSGAEPDAVGAHSTSPSLDAANRPPAVPARRRNRPALSCIQCRTRKVRCDRNEPCNSCLKSKIVNCTYEEARRPKPKFWKLSPGTSPAPGHAGPASHGQGYSEVQFALESNGTRNPLPSGHQYAASAASVAGTSGSLRVADATSPGIHQRRGPASASGSHSADADALASRVKELEEKLAEALKRQDSSHSTDPSVPAVLSKSRYFGSSHWMNNTKLWPFIMSLADRIETDKNSEACIAMDKCKKLARVIKARRVPAIFNVEIGKASSLPAEHVAFRLVEGYFRTFESVYRILHIPTFWTDYRKFWNNPSEANRPFVIQLQLCMAIGSCFQDDVVSLRQSASQWIYEAQHWLASPFEKSRLNLVGLQIMCLLHLARETCGVGADLTWVSLGATLRTAMVMGLHRDPEQLPPMTVLVAELRRRLWATILELVLQSSLDSGGPPLLCVTDFDTKPPSNYDDEQLVETTRFSTGPRPTGTFTQTSVQVALLKSFATRLSIAKYVNELHAPPTYDETLRRNSELTVACRTLSATLQASYDPAGVIPNRVSLFQLQLTEHMMHRFFLVLNFPWLPLSQHNPAYYFSRKLCVETSTKLYRACAKGSPSDGSSRTQVTDFSRLSVVGAGAFRSVPLQAIGVLVIECLWQILEDRKFRQSMNIDQPGLTVDPDAGSSGSMSSGVAPRSELFEAIHYATEWTESRVRHGETNVKGYIFIGALRAQIEATQRGASDAEMERSVLEKVVELSHQSLMLLKELLGGSATPSDVSDLASMTGNSSLDSNMLEEFGFGVNTNDWGWVWDDLGVNLSNMNANPPDWSFNPN